MKVIAPRRLSIKHQILPTMRVKNLENGQEAIINRKDFDEALHAELEAAAAPEPEDPEDDVMVVYTREELARMKAVDLRKLEVWGLLEDRGKLRNKEEMIQAILAKQDEWTEDEDGDEDSEE